MEAACFGCYSMAVMESQAAGNRPIALSCFGCSCSDSVRQGLTSGNMGRNGFWSKPISNSTSSRSEETWN